MKKNKGAVDEFYNVTIDKVTKRIQETNSILNNASEEFRFLSEDELKRMEELTKEAENIAKESEDKLFDEFDDAMNNFLGISEEEVVQEEKASNGQSDSMIEKFKKYNEEYERKDKKYRLHEIIEKASKNVSYLKRVPWYIKNNKNVIASIMEKNPEAYFYSSGYVMFDSGIMGYAQALSSNPNFEACQVFKGNANKFREFQEKVNKIVMIREDVKDIILESHDMGEIKAKFDEKSINRLALRSVYDDKEAMLALIKIDKSNLRWVSSRLSKDKDILAVANGKTTPSGSGIQVSQMGEE